MQSPKWERLVAATLGVLMIAAAGVAYADPPVHTYSIVARDPETGDMGVAVQSHWFSVGSVVTWGEAGVGVVATQSFIDPSYGLKGLELMRAGIPAPEALERLVRADLQREGRQVAFLDAKGNVAAHTGQSAIAAAGHCFSSQAAYRASRSNTCGSGRAGSQYSAQANLMLNDRVWPAMASAFERTQGDLADRLLAALDAAQAEGGDIRGRQSAALLVVRGKSTGRPWAGADRVFDLRVEDHPEPLKELRRLVRLQRAYAHANRGDDLMTEKKVAEALKEYAAAEAIAPEIVELPFWHAVTLASVGREDEAIPIFKAVFSKEPFWADVLQRLPAAGLLPEDPALLGRLRAIR